MAPLPFATYLLGVILILALGLRVRRFPGNWFLIFSILGGLINQAFVLSRFGIAARSYYEIMQTFISVGMLRRWATNADFFLPAGRAKPERCYTAILSAN